MDMYVIHAHTHCMQHKAELLASTLCGCFFCERVFAPTEIETWLSDLVDDWDTWNTSDDTAFCPFCGIDAVIGDASGYPITATFLAAMKAHWF